MISSGVFEQPGRWRWAGIAVIFGFALLPVLPLLGVAELRAGGNWLGTGFVPGLMRSLRVAGGATLISFVIGLTAGVLAGLYQFPFRRFLLTLLVLPLLAPPFLWALGVSMLRSQLGLPPDSFLEGSCGTTLVFAASELPFPLFTSLFATRCLSRSQINAARLAGGEWRAFGLTLRQVFPIGLLAAILGGALTLADPGPGQLLGYEGAASQILISFSATYDFSLGARQSLVLAGGALLAGLPAAIILAPRLAVGLLGRAAGDVPLSRHPAASVATFFLIAGIVAVIPGTPLAGLGQSAIGDFQIGRAWNEAARTLPNTLWYGIGSGLIAAVLGSILALCAGREPLTRIVVLAGLIAVFTLPPALGALGILVAGGDLPAGFDGIFRSKLTVTLYLGLRLFPVATVFAMRRLGSSSPTWARAAAVHGISAPVYFIRILAPWLLRSTIASAFLVGLIALADISSILLLHPPGEGSLPLAIFTIMSNAPESLVASLCLLYVVGSAAIFSFACWLASPFSQSKRVNQ